MPEPFRPDASDLEGFRDYLRVFARAHIDAELRHRIDPSDVVQETLIKAHRSIGQFGGSGHRQLAGWMRRILANTLADAMRKAYREKRNLALERSLQAAVEESSARVEDWLAADQSSPSEQVAYQERLSRLATALADLPDDQRMAVEMHWLRQRSLADVAEQMDRTIASVAGLIRRGLSKLRQRLGDGD